MGHCWQALHADLSQNIATSSHRNGGPSQMSWRALMRCDCSTFCDAVIRLDAVRDDSGIARMVSDSARCERCPSCIGFGFLILVLGCRV